jgi:hypothetical protein
MKSNIYKNSRRDFIQKIAISTAFLSILPEISFGKQSENGLKIGVTEINSDKVQAFKHLLSLQKLAYLSPFNTYQYIDIIYIPNFNNKSLQLIREATDNNICVLIERPNDSQFSENEIITICQNAGVVLVIVEAMLFDKQNQKAFYKTDFYEPTFTSNNNVQRSLDFIKLLNLLTQNNNFRVHQSKVQSSFIVS